MQGAYSWVSPGVSVSPCVLIPERVKRESVNETFYSLIMSLFKYRTACIQQHRLTLVTCQCRTHVKARCTLKINY